MQINKYKQKSLSTKYVLLGAIVVMVSVTMYFANYLVQQAQTLFVGASIGTAQLFFEPALVTLPPNAIVNIWATSDKPLGFIRAEFTFDHTLIKLSEEIVLTNPALKRVIKVTPLSEANTTGKITIILGLDPTTISTAPTGSFKLASLSFVPKVTTSNLTTMLTLATNSLQLVDTSTTPFTVTSAPAIFTLNPVSSPSPTHTPVPTPTASATPSIDTNGPTLKLSSGVSRGKYWIKAVASDPSGISNISMTKDSVIVQTCSKKTSCTYYPSNSFTKPYNVIVTATDKSTPRNITTSSITIN